MQVSLTPKLGGFGLRQVALHAESAYNASQFEVFSTWGSRLGWSSSPVPSPSQREASFSLDSSLLPPSLLLFLPSASASLMLGLGSLPCPPLSMDLTPSF